MFGKSAYIFLFAFILQGAACSDASPPEEAKEPAMANRVDYLTVIPEKTNMLFYANLQELRKTPLGEDFRAEFEKNLHDGDDRDYQEFVARTGIDLREDVHEVWFGGFSEQQRDVEGGVIVTGRFDEGRVLDYIREKEPGKLEERSYRGHTVYIFDKDEHEMTLLQQNVVVMGKGAWVTAIVDQLEDKGRSVLDNQSMADYFAQVRHKDHLWGVVDLTELSDVWAQELRRNSSFKGTESIENMEALVFYTHFDDKTDLYIKGNFTTKEEAETISEMLNGFKAMAKLVVSDDREAVDMLNEIKIESEGAVVTMTSHVDRAFWDKLREKRRSFSEKERQM